MDWRLCSISTHSVAKSNKYGTMSNNIHFYDESLEFDDSDSSSSRNLRNRYSAITEKDIKALDPMVEKRIRKLTEGTKFLSDFDPEKSTRERRKLNRKCYTIVSGSRLNNLYDEKGRYRCDGSNDCDCLDPQCSGCHFPCPLCKSSMCGPVCRTNRKWTYESIEHDGKDLVYKNKKIETKLISNWIPDDSILYFDQI